jgi:hypothetical protein
MKVNRLVLGMVTGVALGLLLPAQGRAQEADEQDPETAALAVVQGLFDAMRASDSSAVSSLWAEGATSLGSSFTTPDGPAISFTPRDDFISLVGGAEPGSLDERYIVRSVIVEDNLVTVVTPYEFYFNGNFTHCGVDVFVIARTGDDWKIVGLTDTRRRGGCEGWLDE